MTVSDIRVYHVSPWRRWTLWYVFGPIILALVVGSAFLPFESGKPGLITAGLVFLIFLPLDRMLGWTRLELSPKGVRLKQIGYTLEAPWAEVAGIRFGRGREAFVTNTPLAGKGAKRLAALRGFGFRGGLSLYDAEQQRLLAERRLIPIEAFAWHLRRGKLRADIVRFAPHLTEALLALDAPLPDATHPPELPRKRGRLKPVSIIVGLVVFGVPLALALSPQHIQDWVPRGSLPLLTLGAAYSAWSSFRTRAWFLGVFFVLVTAVLFVLSVGVWMNFDRR